MKFIVKTEWAGYSRGHATYEVEAESANEAEENWYNGKELSTVTVRDDCESEVTSVKPA